MNVTYKVNNQVTAVELIRVFQSVGWNKDVGNILAAFRKSYYVTAYLGENLIGFARAISDDYYYTGIYDVVVCPEMQHKGIAKTMMRMLIRQFKDTYFFLSYTDGNRDFYARCGFNDLNSAMWIEKGNALDLESANTEQ